MGPLVLLVLLDNLVYLARDSRFSEIRAPVRGLRRPCVFSKKEKEEPFLVPHSFLRRERDSLLSTPKLSNPLVIKGLIIFQSTAHL